MPWCESGICLLNHLVDRFFVEIPFFTVAPVFVCYFPLLFRRVLPVGEPLQLRIFVDLDPELDDDGAPVDELFLKFVDLIIGALPVIFTAETFQPLDKCLAFSCGSGLAMGCTS